MAMANWCVFIQQQAGAKSEKPLQRSFTCDPDEIDRGISALVRQWAGSAKKGERLTVTVRRDL
jgi:hypothetical protein